MANPWASSGASSARPDRRARSAGSRHGSAPLRRGIAITPTAAASGDPAKVDLTSAKPASHWAHREPAPHGEPVGSDARVLDAGAGQAGQRQRREPATEVRLDGDQMAADADDGDAGHVSGVHHPVDPPISHHVHIAVLPNFASRDRRYRGLEEVVAGQVFTGRRTSLRAGSASQVFARLGTASGDKDAGHRPEGSASVGHAFKTGVGARAPRRVRFPSASAARARADQRVWNEEGSQPVRPEPRPRARITS